VVSVSLVNAPRTPNPPSAPSVWDGAMTRCLALGDEAARLGEVPIGALVMHDGAIVGEGYNRREIDHDPLAHAELRAIAAAAKKLGRWRLSGCTLVVTLEPCFMCAGAIVNARVDRVVYGAADPKAGACESLAHVVTDPRLNHRVDVVSGVMAEQCGDALRAFFADLRRRSSAC
jgi:tRNA(adenine34) deaminase